MNENEIKQYINERIEEKLTLIDYKLSIITDNILKINDIEKRLNKVEANEEKRELNCPFRNKIETLQVNQLNQQAIKKYIVKTIAITATITSIILTLLNIATKLF